MANANRSIENSSREDERPSIGSVPLRDVWESFKSNPTFFDGQSNSPGGHRDHTRIQHVHDVVIVTR